MRILFDGFWWAEGPVSNRNVQREIVLAWIAAFPEDEIVVAVPRGAERRARAELRSGVEVQAIHLAPHGLSVILELPFVARRLRADLVVTHNFSPIGVKSAVFVHDFMFVTSPEWFTPFERLYFSLMPATLRRSRVVFTSTETEAGRVKARAGKRPVVAVGLDLSRALRDATPRRPDSVRDIERFLLSIGRLNVRKNLSNTLAGAIRSGRLSSSRPLLVVGESGGRSAGFSAEVLQAIDDGRVRMLGRLDDDEVAWLYRQAEGVLFLSLDEGFGLPALEAYEFGAPVLLSDIPVFHEVLGDHATFADPTDVDAIAEGVARLPGRSPATGASAHDLGYSWDQTVRKMRAAVIATPWK